MCHGQAFFAAAVDACRRLGRRGILLSRHTEHLPPSLPGTVMHAAYAPFSELLPRAAALVHHGGIGTTAQAMRAGVPQLLMPMSHDQPDNALRVEKFGVGAALPPKKFTGPAVAKTLDGLLNSPRVAAACRAVAERFGAGSDALEKTVKCIEQVGAGARATEPAGTTAQ